MRIYVRIREMMMLHKDILQRLENIERKLNGQDNQIMVVFEYLKQFEQTKQQELEQKNRPKKDLNHRRNNPVRLRLCEDLRSSPHAVY